MCIVIHFNAMFRIFCSVNMFLTISMNLELFVEMERKRELKLSTYQIKTIHSPKKSKKYCHINRYLRLGSEWAV